MKILPPGITFMQAVRMGYTGRIECRGYLDWIKTLPCHTCGRWPGDQMNPIDPSHINAFKGQGTKSPDLWALPECRPCHETYERGPACEDDRLRVAALYLLQAFYLRAPAMGSEAVTMFITFNGKSQSLTEWAIDVGLERSTISQRLKKGWSVAAALNPKDTRGAHRRGAKWPEWVKKKISAAHVRRSRELNLGGRYGWVPLYVADLDEPIGLVSDCILYADPLEILCAAEEADARTARVGAA